ncbi:MAG: hypothetical protein J7M30_17075 [Deltaproteobacteria bacterium]|nr:hypothetical protein [Deltaproteobacteria bacterium]
MDDRLSGFFTLARLPLGKLHRLRMIMLLIALTVLLVCVLFGFKFMRSELPYALEISPLEGGAEVVNTTLGERSLLVKYRDRNGKLTEVEIKETNVSYFIENLRRDGPTVLRISRKDFLGRLKYKERALVINPGRHDRKYVVLVGASIGRF